MIQLGTAKHLILAAPRFGSFNQITRTTNNVWGRPRHAKNMKHDLETEKVGSKFKCETAVENSYHTYTCMHTHV